MLPTCALVLAAALGSVHAAFSFYWASDGTALTSTLGAALVDSFRGHELLLVPVGAVKLCAAVAPLLLARMGWPVRSLTRPVCWIAALVLITWGGANTLTGNLVLAGFIHPEGRFDRSGMLGHAYLWDPMFLAWGIALALGLLASRDSGASLRRRPEQKGSAGPGP